MNMSKNLTFEKIKEQLIVLIADIKGVEVDAIRSNLTFSYNPGSDFILDISEMPFIDLPELNTRSDGLFQAAQVTDENIEISLNYEDAQLVFALLTWIEKRGKRYGLANKYVPYLVKIQLCLNQKCLEDISILTAQFALQSTLSAMYSVLGSKVHNVILLADSRQSYQIADLPVDNYSALTLTPISVFRSQVDLQEIRSTLLQKWETSFSSGGLVTSQDYKIEFNTDLYTYKNLLDVAYNWVSSTGGSVINETPCIRVNQKLVPLFVYDSTVYKLGELLALTTSQDEDETYEIFTAPRLDEWSIVKRMVSSQVSDRCVIAFHLPILMNTDMSDEEINSGFISQSLKDSVLHFAILLISNSDDVADDWYERGRKGFNLVHRAFELTQENGQGTISQELLALPDVRELIRQFLHFPYLIRLSVIKNKPSIIAKYLTQIAEMYISIKENSRIPDILNRICQLILVNSTHLLGFKVDTTN